MSIFESLENLPVSEACLEDIISLVEEEINKKDIEGARNRKLRRLETIGKSLDKQSQKAISTFREAQKNADRALTPDSFQQARQAREEAREKMENALNKEHLNSEATLKLMRGRSK